MTRLSESCVVGIIANPASGKDIRRLVAYAATLDNQSKVGIIRCALVGMGAVGVSQVLIMPDAHRLGDKALIGLKADRSAVPAVDLLDMAVTDRPEDSAQAAQLMREAGAQCLIVLGGDGTSRVVSKGAEAVPLLPISTGTNNVLPSFTEGTVAGLAAGAVALGWVQVSSVARRHKWLQIYVNGEPRDRALVDVAALRGSFVGTRAVWSADDLVQIIVTRAQPASIGISSIIGVLEPISADELTGVVAEISPAASRRVLAAIGPGLLRPVGIESMSRIPIGKRVPVALERPLVLALDGEREIVLYEGDSAQVELCSDGPWIVDAHRVLDQLTRGGAFVLENGRIHAPAS